MLCVVAFTAQGAEPDALKSAPATVDLAPHPTDAPPSLAPTPTAETPDEQAGIIHRWWFWTAVGAVAFAGFTAGALIISLPHARETTLQPGDFR
jgi:hypothetical protein